ncbi:NAD(P)-dependent dehydrogenase (short-subunit alcohol dehydrogenase family) [Allocatelliglobosispora scoriae]|uniref:NAD(P)-dependent dehydrogenase (Short-subunit alcohol dehydrogenase family) n=1 Tax=Allocatelliglobosispora scoriae TaxID=643052 RepID=A0A841BN27_9ACTN|nr:SDR family oxidoreductase [Allocatelliglobosispora scoriae]MBB5869075.1 NAD(P)-dependent dehydrogenase (short-subunit alcohol dehydrogenase family) [Allocatelliglobosispora scoriae]
MRVSGRVVAITGATGGIGAALARRFAAEGAAAIGVSDLTDPEPLAVELRALGVRSIGVRTDVADEASVREFVERTEAELGPIDLFCANAGIATGLGLLDAADADWERAWRVNTMAHIYSTRAVLPGMLERGSGYLLHTASAAGLLTALGDAPYSVSKHAAVAFAEWLAIMYGDRGITVSALCPQGVNTPLLMDGVRAGSTAARSVAAAGSIIEPEQVADAVIAGLDEERFLILPHPEVAEFLVHKASDPDRWVRGVRRLRDVG